ncbi:hypothetical protein DERP_010379 [Dermatophagoides pteronyssinus]|uniref:Uncharacterized protein n=1 Tax=Dermatophagoides pteronyssinus TaxID=6956 RepID=A0ABQ8J4Z6_DERPT|nr:hypothetical protein DERP_010379 [Dermatophagoides pteronyssinus]
MNSYLSAMVYLPNLCSHLNYLMIDHFSDACLFVSNDDVNDLFELLCKDDLPCEDDRFESGDLDRR